MKKMSVVLVLTMVVSLFCGVICSQASSATAGKYEYTHVFVDKPTKEPPYDSDTGHYILPGGKMYALNDSTAVGTELKNGDLTLTTKAAGIKKARAINFISDTPLASGRAVISFDLYTDVANSNFYVPTNTSGTIAHNGKYYDLLVGGKLFKQTYTAEGQNHIDVVLDADTDKVYVYLNNSLVETFTANKVWSNVTSYKFEWVPGSSAPSGSILSLKNIEFKWIKPAVTEFTLTDKTASANVYIAEDSTVNCDNIKLYIAGYESDDTLVSLKISNSPIIKGQNNAVNVEMSEEEANGAVKFKAFIWDEMTPLTVAK